MLGGLHSGDRFWLEHQSLEELELELKAQLKSKRRRAARVRQMERLCPRLYGESSCHWSKRYDRALVLAGGRRRVVQTYDGTCAVRSVPARTGRARAPRSRRTVSRVGSRGDPANRRRLEAASATAGWYRRDRRGTCPAALRAQGVRKTSAGGGPLGHALLPWGRLPAARIPGAGSPETGEDARRYHRLAADLDWLADLNGGGPSPRKPERWTELEKIAIDAFGEGRSTPWCRYRPGWLLLGLLAECEVEPARSFGVSPRMRERTALADFRRRVAA